MKERMCISCKKRFFQDNLFRFRCYQKEILKYKGFGRSAYFCQNCIKDDKKIHNALNRLCKDKDDTHIIKFKEIFLDVR